jgi:xanthine dehydrogenase YagS FAD-binding subunit
MNRFNYTRAASIAEAVEAASAPGAIYLAGGTNVLDLMKGGIVQPKRLVDITRISELNETQTLRDGSFRIGALVRNADLAHDHDFAHNYPAIAEALLAGASAQLRNAATAAGNIMQRTRCPYFYDTASACNRRDPDAGCDARGGATRLHAILGWSDHCIATHPSDFCVPLTALGAIVEITGPQGHRDILLEAFYLAPGETPEHETVLAQGELITALRLPPHAKQFASHSRYIKLRDRTSYAFAIVSAATALRMEGDTIAEARVALGGVAAKPWRAHEAEKRLAGQQATVENFRLAATAAMRDAKPSGENAYKIELARRIIMRALTLAAAGTRAPVAALPASVFGAHSGASIHA